MQRFVRICVLYSSPPPPAYHSLLNGIFSLSARIGHKTTLSTGCVVGVMCTVDADETLPPDTIVLGENHSRRIADVPQTPPVSLHNVIIYNQSINRSKDRVISDGLKFINQSINGSLPNVKNSQSINQSIDCLNLSCFCSLWTTTWNTCNVNYQIIITRLNHPQHDWASHSLFQSVHDASKKSRTELQKFEQFSSSFHQFTSKTWLNHAKNSFMP